MIMPILKTRDPRHREGHYLAQGHSANKESLGFAVELVENSAAQPLPERVWFCWRESK